MCVLIGPRFSLLELYLKDVIARASRNTFARTLPTVVWKTEQWEMTQASMRDESVKSCSHSIIVGRNMRAAAIKSKAA